MNQIKIQGVCTCVPQFSYEKDRRGRSVPTCRYILAVQRPKSSYSDYMYCVAFGERAMIAFQKIKKGTTVFVQGHLHTEEGRDANNQKVYFVSYAGCSGNYNCSEGIMKREGISSFFLWRKYDK